MSFSDDEEDTLPQSVTNYHFEDHNKSPISFSKLPLNNPTDSSSSSKKSIFLNGVIDDGMQKIYKQVIAWKFDLSSEKPEISVLSKDKNWIKLLKARNIFEETVRSVLVTVNCLHFVKKHPDAEAKAVWNRLSKIFSAYVVKPSENDLVDSLSLIQSTVKQDETLSKSKFLMTFLENPMKRKVLHEDTDAGLDKFIVEDAEEDEDSYEANNADAEGESDEEADLFDSVCAICDNGGEILSCEGRCLRSFHATVDAGEDTDCVSLGFSKAEVKAMNTFLCWNCQHKKHQCFACGKTGSSDKSAGAEVFHCVSATCGYFYHPECVAKLLCPTDEAEADELQRKISEGESFTCPVHKCYSCKQVEDKDKHELQFAVCRRCPKVYHRKCLPRKIAFEDVEEEDITTRAWDNLLPINRILIYCLKHKIDEDLGTPIRNHIDFLNFNEMKKTRALDLAKKRKGGMDRRSLDGDDFFGQRNASKVQKRAVSDDVKQSASSVKTAKPSFKKELDSSEKLKRLDSSGKPPRSGLKNNKPSAILKSRISSLDEERLAKSEPLKSKSKEVGSSKPRVSSINTHPPQKQPTFQLDAETKKRITHMMEEKASLITLAQVVRAHKVPSTHTSSSSKAVLDKTITLGKVEQFTEAVRTALQKLEAGGSVEDAKAVCGPQIVEQITKWKEKLKVYLAPFIYGMRYTSFGRHFTKVDKLKEIVDLLHLYTQDGDMIVDFCCGANDFSLLMKEKLEETGKKCSFKNFDVIHPKNDFSFEKRDWMTVRPKELPNGSNLIMGLNPPFGVKAALANRFIDKALEFRPKLVILIVPPETERLDRKNYPYDLIWENEQQLSGKSFYLPGSVDVNDNQMDQWNVKPPPLYLWSRPDWTSKHMAVAMKHNHLSKEQKEMHMEVNGNESRHSEEMDISPSREHHAAASNVDLPKQKDAVADETVSTVRKNSGVKSPPKHDTGVHKNNDTDYRNSKDRNNKKKQRSHEWQAKGKKSKPKAETQDELGSSVEAYTPEPIASREGSNDGSIAGLEQRTRYTDMSTNNFEDLGTRRYSPDGVSPDSSRVQGLDGGQFPGYNVMSGYGRTPYQNEQDAYKRESDLEQSRRHYGGADLDYLSRHNQFPGSLSSTPYGLSGLAAEASYGVRNTAAIPSAPYGLSSAGTNTSAMHRYAPQLDELNHTRPYSLGSQTRPGNPGLQYTPVPPPNPYANMSGFAPGLRHPPHYQSSSGWLND